MAGIKQLPNIKEVILSSTSNNCHYNPNLPRQMDQSQLLETCLGLLILCAPLYSRWSDEHLDFHDSYNDIKKTRKYHFYELPLFLATSAKIIPFFPPLPTPTNAWMNNELVHVLKHFDYVCPHQRCREHFSTLKNFGTSVGY